MDRRPPCRPPLNVYRTECSAPGPHYYQLKLTVWNRRTITVRLSGVRLLMLLDQLQAILAEQNAPPEETLAEEERSSDADHPESVD